MDEHGPGPAVLGVLAGIPVAQLRVIELAQELDDVTPRQMCNAALHNLVLRRPGLGERSHIEEISSREALHRGELGAQVGCEPLEHLRSPGLLCLPVQARPADAPVQPQQFSVRSALRPEASVVNVLFQLFERRGVVVGHQVSHVPDGVRRVRHTGSNGRERPGAPTSTGVGQRRAARSSMSLSSRSARRDAHPWSSLPACRVAFSPSMTSRR